MTRRTWDWALHVLPVVASSAAVVVEFVAFDKMGGPQAWIVGACGGVGGAVVAAGMLARATPIVRRATLCVVPFMALLMINAVTFLPAWPCGATGEMCEPLMVIPKSTLLVAPVIGCLVVAINGIARVWRDRVLQALGLSARFAVALLSGLLAYDDGKWAVAAAVALFALAASPRWRRSVSVSDRQAA
jgi:hypothetical protein